MGKTKITCAPLIFDKNKFIIDFKRKANIFNHFFATQCILVGNTTKLSSVLENRILQTQLRSILKGMMLKKLSKLLSSDIICQISYVKLFTFSEFVTYGVNNLLPPLERFCSPASMRNGRWKKSHNFQRLLLFSILYNDILTFSEN